MNFINLCDQRHILLLVLPLYSIHRLQPWDVACFVPLARYYTNELNQLIEGSLEYNNMSKQLFWKIFLSAWNKAFLSQNIASGWIKTGLFLPNPVIVLINFIAPTIPAKNQELQTPMTSRTIRRFQKSFLSSPTDAKTKLLLKANKHLVAEYFIAIHINRGLEQVMKLEKHK
jgi:hypothetical protein